MLHVINLNEGNNMLGKEKKKKKAKIKENSLMIEGNKKY